MKRISSMLILLAALLLILATSGCTSSHPAAPTDATVSPTLSTVTPAATEPAEMKTIGIIGGVSWASSIEYCRIMNEKV
ncbi:MAG: hypothetical protein WC620_03995 [Methanoregula sp.]